MTPEILIATNAISQFDFSKYSANKVVLITDENVLRAQGIMVKNVLSKFGIEPLILSIPAGESSKSREMKEILEDKMQEAHCGRDTVVFGFGGGVVLDLAGFVAATYCRGLPFLSIPTSLLAMVDAAIGGKTGVNTPRGKNLIGAFHHPDSIVMDLSTLETLPQSEWIHALSEVVKSAMIADKKLFEFLEHHVDAILNRDSNAVLHIVQRCSQIKSEVVTADPKEENLRAILNLGHTIAHAIEAKSDYQIHHGQAVAYGMLFEAEIAKSLNYFSHADLKRLKNLLEKFQLFKTPYQDPRESLIIYMQNDKKNRNQQVHMVLPAGIGRVYQEQGCYSVPIDLSSF